MVRVAVTTFYTNSYEPLADITTEILKKYCKKHQYYLEVNILEDSEGFHFKKTKFARELLTGEFDVVVAIENDILITNHTYKIEDWVDDEHDFYCTKDVNNVNTGIFIVKNTEWSKRMLDSVNYMEVFYGDEQNYFESHTNDKIKYCEHPCFNSIAYEEYAPSYGYIHWEQYNPRKEKPTHEMGCWEIGDFALHLPGMTFQKRLDIFNKHLKDIIYE